MKSKITLLVLLIILPVMSFMGNEAFAQTVSGIASNTGCFNSGIVTASSTGLGATPQYQLSKAGVVVAPVSGDPTQFTNTNVFTGLSSGVYVVNARATAGGTVFSSTNITVTDGYTAMTVSTPTKVADCVGGTASLTSTVTAGKAPYTYTIAAQSAPGVILQNSGPISATTFNFNPLGVNNYLVSVTDDCGQTITGATSISNPTVTVNDFKLGSLAYPSFNTTNNCSTPLNVINELLFQYTANSTTISASDAARFSWKILYQGQLYGQDTNADGYSDVGGAGYSPLLNTVRLPLVATKAGVLAEIASGTMKVVLSDNCGNSKEFNVTQYNSGGTMGPSNCAGAGLIRAVPNRLSCFPLNVTFTNIANPADIVTTTINSTAQLIAGFTAGATYHVTYVDAQGSTTRSFDTLPVSQNISIPAASTFTISQVLTGVQQNLNVLGYGRLILTVTPVQAGDIINYTVTASDNPLVPVGYTSSTPLNATSGSATLPRVNASDPLDYWPSGHYTLDMTIPCGTRTINATVSGYNATLNGNTITPVCGGFNYVMNGNFDSVSAYQVIIVSGPSSVGQVRDLASNTASLPFNGLSYGTYVFGLRIKGGTVNVLTQTLTYDSNNVITVDKTNTGGYVCSSGATNGTLTIAATSNSPAPGNVLEYALSTDGGTNFGAYQSGNTFSGLTDNTYFFRIKDGCGNIITQSAQIGVAAAPTATAEGQSTPATFCNLSTGTLQLDVDTVGAISYLWTGPGITPANETLKSPLVNYNALSVGNNNFSCSVTFGPPCSSTTVSNLTINITALPVVSITNPAAVCFPNTVDITAPAITAGSETGLTYSYFTDSEGTDPIVDPTIIDVSGTYYIKGTNATCSNIQPVTVIVNSLPIAGITYPSTPYCQTGTATVTQTGITGGTYSGDAGLIIDAVTGTIDLAGSTIGDHTVTYSFTDGTCSSTDIALIEINELPTASIAYSSSPYCNSGTATVTQTGEAGGTYSGDTGLIIDPSTGTIDLALSTVGTHTITYNFSNATCSGTTTASITINATVAPSVLADITGQCEATPIAPTITDPCAGTITGVTTTLFPITTQGTTVVTWTFDYGNGYTQTANQNVIIDDTLGPVMPILADVTGECSATPTVPIATDTCTGAITGATTTSFPITAKGTTIVLWTFDDGNGNISFANQNVIITDTTAPVVPVLADVTAECSATPVTATTTDNCDSGVITGTTSTIFPITTQGTTVVTWNFTDSSGNTSTATQNIIIDDTIAPVAPVLADVIGQCDATPSAPTATDACSGTITGTTTTAFPITTQGTTVVTWTFDDGNGNTSTANQNVIIDDTIAPVVPVLADLTGQCDATPIAPTAADACAGTITGTTTTVFPITAQGTTVVTWTFDDGNGNIATAAQNVIIDDTVAPVAPVLADVTGQCNATPAVPTAADACAGIITGTTTTVFPITTQGTTVVTWTFDDGNGNIATAAQNVIIDDTVAPVPPVLADVIGQCNATPAVPTAVDACAGTITGTTTTAFPITVQGTTVVTWTFDDGNGNIATAAQNVIIDDTIAPVAPVLADVTGQCNATPAVPTATDACAGVVTGTTTTAFPITAQGTTVVIWTFDDGNGNIATAAQNVIIDDTVAPVPPVLADVTGQCNATPTVPTATDACAGTITGTTTTTFPITAQGTTVVTWTFNDGNGNIATANQNVIISPRTLVSPVLADITGQCSVTPIAPVILDSCGAAITGTTTTLFPITTPGTTIINWTFSTGSGSSVTAAQNVIITNVALSGTSLATCLGSGNQYNVTLSVTGQGPYTATGTGAPGTWSGNTWTSNTVAVGTNYSVNIQDANACNTITVSGVSPVSCCTFNVICPTFQPTTVSCYDQLPTAVTLTKAQFETLGNGNGRITSCGAIEITASNSADQGCNANITRSYTVTEYNDANGNGIRDAGENTILNSTICTQTITVHDTTAPVFVEAMPQAVVNANCDTIPPVVTLTATDNCGTATVTYEENRVDGDCSSRYTLLRTWTANDQCGNQTSYTQTINVACLEEIYNGISSNGDGINDSFVIKGIDCYPNNSVKIYNRYGVIVYEKDGYDNVTSPFQGYSDGRATVKKGDKLPTGTYFYTVQYDNNGNKVEKAGYLYVNNQ